MKRIAPVDTRTVPDQKKMHISQVGGIHNLLCAILSCIQISSSRLSVFYS